MKGRREERRNTKKKMIVSKSQFRLRK